jgi:hypothetical protein
MADDSQSRIHSERKIVSRSEAKEQGLKRYFTGVPCCNGHLSNRQVSDRNCCECKNIRTKDTRKDNPELHRERCRKWRRDNPEKSKASNERWRSLNLDRVKETHKTWLKKNPGRTREYSRKAYYADVEATRAAKKKDRDENPEKYKRYSRSDYLKNRDVRKAAVRTRYHKNRAKCIAAMAIWRKRNPEKARSIARKWARANIDSICAWQERNREKVRLYVRAAKAQRRARQKEAEGRFTKGDIDRLKKLQRGLCAYCKIALKKKYHIDHITPLAGGGSNWPSNLQLCCPTCNHQKHAMDPIEFAQSIGRLI